MTYALHQGITLEVLPLRDGVTCLDDVKEKLAEGGVAGVLMQQPNVTGIIEDFTGFADAVHEQKALLIINSIAADLAVLKTPAEWGADIAVGDGQSLGIPMSFGGPGVGYMCVTEKLMRKMPGRIVGMTTSNICSNQSLMALYVTIYLAVMGRQGVKEAAELSYAGAHYLCEQLTQTGSFKLKFNQPFFNEFCMTYDGDIDALQAECADNGFMAGVKVDDNTIMFAVTEQRTKEEIDELVDLIKQIKEDQA